MTNQVLGTIIAGTVNLGVAWYLLSNIDGICHPDPKSNSPWTCSNDIVFFDASVIWGLVGPKRIFGPLGNYGALNWFFLGGIIGPVVVWLCHKAFPSVSWISLINLQVLLGATAYMPPAAAVNYNSWILVGTIFNFFVFRYRKMWWKRYNYILSAALDAGVAFMVVLLNFTTGLEDINADTLPRLLELYNMRFLLIVVDSIDVAIISRLSELDMTPGCSKDKLLMSSFEGPERNLLVCNFEFAQRITAKLSAIHQRSDHTPSSTAHS
ncbi:oligopeptide transporter 4-like protein [Tanacetum coccineum]